MFAQGNCSEPLPAWAQVAPGAPAIPGQCAVAVPCTFMRNAEPYGNSLWLSHLHIQLTGATSPPGDAEGGGTSAILWTGRTGVQANLWVSNVTLAGEGRSSTGMEIQGGTVCLAGATPS